MRVNALAASVEGYRLPCGKLLCIIHHSSQATAQTGHAMHEIVDVNGTAVRISSTAVPLHEVPIFLQRLLDVG